MYAKISAAAAALLLILALTASASAGAASRPTVKLARTSLGTILVTGSGRTVYMFSRDSRNTDRCVRISGCVRAWPLVTTRTKPVAGRGVRASLLGTIRIPGRTARQLTYGGHPLYTFSGDSGSAQTEYVGVNEFGGTWPALNAAGRKVT